MKLENVTAEIRPRGKWESVDLGVALTQKNFKAVMTAWVVTVAPLMLILLGGTYAWFSCEDLHYDDDTFWLLRLMYIGFPFFIVWWLKPIYERVPLYILSRSLFGEDVSITQLAMQWPGMIFKDFLTLLFFRRISMNRSFVMPIHELEGLKGTYYRQRVSLLSRNGGDGAAGLTTACSFLTTISMFTGIATFLMLFGYGFANEAFTNQIVLFMQASVGLAMDSHSVFSLVFFMVCYMLVLTLFTPFYVGAGFAIYVNSRTISEGWDIELAFKRMSDRLVAARAGKNSSVLGLILLVSLCLFGLTPQSQAATRNEDNIEAEKVMDDKAFDLNTYKETVYEVDEEEDIDVPNEPALAVFGSFASIMMYVVFAAVIVFLVYLLVKNAHIFKGGKVGTTAIDEHVRARSVLGMDVTPESLPKNIVEAAREAWMRGEKQLALSLFYRGSLVWLVNSARLPITESDTESDCARHAQTIDSQPMVQYFDRLTQTWMAQAYGKIEPEDSDIDWLCNDWPFNVRVIIKEGGES